MLTLKSGRSASAQELSLVRQIYTEAFPPEERREWSVIEELLASEPDFTMTTVHDADRLVGFITGWDMGGYIYLEHFATDPSVRNKGYGASVISSVLSSDPRPHVLEAERPDTPLAARRIAFYRRAGFLITDTEYIQPPYSPQGKGVPMYVMSSGGYRRAWAAEIRDKVYNRGNRQQYTTIMNNTTITNDIRYIGVNDRDIDLFESQYKVPNGVSYNSYLILDEKTAVLDTVDYRKHTEWMERLEAELAGRTPDYLIVHHLEPDHAGSIAVFAERYPQARIVLSTKAAGMIGQFFPGIVPARLEAVSEGQTLCLGRHTLTFVMAPMVHWPEVMVSYESTEKILFAADGFGKFGALDAEEPWDDEARRYFINIVGKYGAQVQALLKKASALDIRMICPLHGPVLRENLGHFIGKYDTWSSYRPEDNGVLVAFASIHGNTAKAARYIASELEARGVRTVISDLSRDDMHKAVADAFRFDKMILACASYDAGIFPPMEKFLNHLRAKNFQKRTVALVENGSWAPCAARIMRSALEGMKDITICDNTVSIRSVMKDCDKKSIDALIDEITGR